VMKCFLGIRDFFRASFHSPVLYVAIILLNSTAESALSVAKSFADATFLEDGSKAAIGSVRSV